jgi:putative nucleotidyltransferase with HDIG domain
VSTYAPSVARFSRYAQELRTVAGRPYDGTCQHGGVVEDEARGTAEQLLGAVLPQRWRHVQEVAPEAGRLCDGLHVDRRVVVCAAWLHDVGYARALAPTGFHPLDGARYLRSHGWDDAICRLVAHHTDAASQATARGGGDQLREEFAPTGSRDLGISVRSYLAALSRLPPPRRAALLT